MCGQENKGAVVLVVLNLDQGASHSLHVPVAGFRYTLSAPQLLSKSDMMNGRELKANADGTVPNMSGESFGIGDVRFEPATITFLVFLNARNSSCM
jgi:hypothetical protein